MDISKDGGLGRLYKWFYQLDSNEFTQDGCLFLRKIFFAILLCIPYYLYLIPYTLLMKCGSRKIQFFFNFYISSSKHERGLLSTVIYLFFLVLYTIIIFLFNIKEFNLDNKVTSFYMFSIEFGGLVFYIIGTLSILGFIVYSIYFLALKKVNLKKESIVGVYYKSIKEKYCFKINWINDN